MVLAVESGIYIAEDAKGVHDARRSIAGPGEDRVLVVRNGSGIQIAGLSQDLSNIEALRRGM